MYCRRPEYGVQRYGVRRGGWLMTGQISHSAKARKPRRAKSLRRRKTRIDSRRALGQSRSTWRPKTMPETVHRDPMQDFADRIVAELEKGTKPWVPPWDQEKARRPAVAF
jgi:hypothetical protein